MGVLIDFYFSPLKLFFKKIPFFFLFWIGFLVLPLVWDEGNVGLSDKRAGGRKGGLGVPAASGKSGKRTERRKENQTNPARQFQPFPDFLAFP